MPDSPEATDNHVQLVSLVEAARHIGVHPRTLRRRIADGSLIGHRLPPGRLIRVNLRDVENLGSPIPVDGA